MALVHGSMDRGAGFARAMRALDGHHVLRYDRRGYGHSAAQGPPADMDAHVRDLLDLLDGRRSVVVGHSYGGIVGLTAAARAPEVVEAVVAFEAPLSWLPWWPDRSAGGTAVSMAAGDGDHGAAAEVFVRRLVGDERWEALPARTRQERRAEGAALVAELTSLRHSAAPFDPSRLDLPVIAARGTRSPAHMQRAAEELAAWVPGAELAVIEGADHGVHLSHPVELAALAERALARLR